MDGHANVRMVDAEQRHLSMLAIGCQYKHPSFRHFSFETELHNHCLCGNGVVRPLDNGSEKGNTTSGKLDI